MYKALTSRALRFVLFFSCRKYLLRSLYHDLQDLSSDTKVTVSTQSEVPSSTSQRIDASGDSDYELDSLPAPNTQAKSHDVGVKGKKGSLHSVLARTAFSVCFSECCIMFLMLMAQGMDTFDPRCVYAIENAHVVCLQLLVLGYLIGRYRCSFC